MGVRVMTSDGGPTFDDFVEQQAGGLARLAYLLTGDHESARDLAQDTLLLAFRKWRHVQAAEDARAYVNRMLTNAYLSQARRKRLVELPLGPDRHSPSQGADPAGDPFGAVDEGDALWRAVHELSPRQRTVIVLRYVYDLGDDDIGALMDCRASSVRSLATRALAALRENQHLGHDNLFGPSWRTR